MIIKFTDLFIPFRGANTNSMPELTEEEIYKLSNYPRSIEKVPVLSGTDLDKGVFGFIPNFLDPKVEIKENEYYIKKNRIRYFINKEGCLTMIRCGNAGKLFYRSPDEFPLFSLTTSIFVFFKKKDSEIKEKYPDFDGLNLKWFSMKFNPLFSNLINREGLSTIPLKIIEKTELEIPKKVVQDKEEKSYQILLDTYFKLKELSNKIKLLSQKDLIISKKFNGGESPASDIFEFISGNSGLTEEFIYSRMNLNESKRYKILSSSTMDRTYMGEIPLCKLPNGRELNFFEDKEGILVIRNGKAGKLIYLPKGNYTLNDHAYILSLNKKYQGRIILEWILYQYQNLFYEFSSSSDNGTWNKTAFLENAQIKIIPIDKQKTIIKSFSEVNDLMIRINKSILKIENIFEKELVS